MGVLSPVFAVGGGGGGGGEGEGRGRGEVTSNINGMLWYGMVYLFFIDSTM